MSMDVELSRFAVENCSLIEDAQGVLNQVEEAFLEKMNAYLGELLEEMPGFDYHRFKDGEISFGCEAWGKNARGVPQAAFWLDCQGNDTERSWLSVLCGKAPGTSAGIFFWYRWGDNNIKRKAWKAYLADFFVKNPELGEMGFCLSQDGEAIVKPILLDQHCLAAHIENPAPCLDAMADAAEAIAASREIFEKLVKEAPELGGASTDQI